MKIFNNIVKHGQKLLRGINPHDKQQLEEIKKLEKQIQEFQEEEKKDKKDIDDNQQTFYQILVCWNDDRFFGIYFI
jgi:DNA-binding protein H-NS